MEAPIFDTLKAAPAVTALLQASGSGAQLRVYPAGEAPQNVEKPYLTYQQISGSPENLINSVPLEDSFGNQIDIYGLTLADVAAVAIAVRDAIEPVAYITAWLGTGRETDTRLYRKSFEVDWITERTTN